MSEKRKVLFRRHASLLKRTTQMDEADATFLPAVNINAASLGEAAGSVCSPRIIWRHGLGWRASRSNASVDIWKHNELWEGGDGCESV
jgi:hypothetical protein